MPNTNQFPARSHNHRACIGDALHKATQLCDAKNLRFTPIRQRVFEMVWANHEPILAYDLLKTLRKEKRNAEAPTIYRALDFLTKHGLVHKIESLNAFIGCPQPDQAHLSQFLICTQCKQVAEINNNQVSASIGKQAKTAGFSITDQTIEIMGICPRCQALS